MTLNIDQLSMPINNRIAAVIVTYRPDIMVLRELIKSVCPQVDTLLIVNNGPASDLVGLELLECKFNIVQFDQNLGVGEAINYAIERLYVDGYAFALTLDQDSIPASDMVQQLLVAYCALASQGVKVAGVGPVLIDRRSGKKAAFTAPVKSLLFARRYIFPPQSGVVEVEHLITSGMLAPLNSYKIVGAPRGDLFIDYVDIEWSLRARYFGLGLYAVGDALMQHSIGDRFKWFMGRQVIIHSPLRNYYQTRNRIFLQQLPTIPLTWKISDFFELLIKLMAKFLFFLLFLPDGLTRVRMILRGINDGLRGKLGIYRGS